MNFLVSSSQCAANRSRPGSRDRRRRPFDGEPSRQTSAVDLPGRTFVGPPPRAAVARPGRRAARGHPRHQPGRRFSRISCSCTTGEALVRARRGPTAARDGRRRRRGRRIAEALRAFLEHPLLHRGRWVHIIATVSGEPPVFGARPAGRKSRWSRYIVPVVNERRKCLRCRALHRCAVPGQ